MAGCYSLGTVRGCTGGVCTAACPPTPPAPGVKRRSEHVALPSAPISTSPHLGTAARTPQGDSSCKPALFPPSPAGKVAEQRFPPRAHPRWRAEGGQPWPWAGPKGWGVAASAWLSLGLSPTSHSCFPFFPGGLSAGRRSRLPTALAPRLPAPCGCFSAGRGSSWRWRCLCCSRPGVSVSVAPLLIFVASAAQFCLRIKSGMIGLVKFGRGPSAS